MRNIIVNLVVFFVAIMFVIYKVLEYLMIKLMKFVYLVVNEQVYINPLQLDTFKLKKILLK